MSTYQDGTTNYFQIHKKILRMAGISLNSNEKIPYKIYSFITLSILLTYQILDTYELFKHDFQTSSGIVLYVMYSLMTAAKGIALLINRTKVKKILDKLEAEPFLANPKRGGDEEKIIIGQCVWLTNLQGYMYGGLNVVGTTIITLYALSKRLRINDYHKWRFVFGTLTFLDISKSRNYPIMFGYQYVCSLIHAGIYVTTDLLVMGVLTHITYQFKVLQNYLRNIVAYTHRDITMQEPSVLIMEIESKYLQNSLKQAIQYHTAILNLAKEVDESFRYMFLVTFLITVGFLCFETYELSLMENSSNGVPQHITEYLTNAFQVLAICYYGEEMLWQSTEVGNAAFEAKFVDTDASFQKSLAMVIQKSQNPVKLSAEKFADISLATSVWVLKTSYTMWMILRNTNEK